MEQASTQNGVKSKAATVSTSGLRVKKDTKRRVTQELAKINKKDFGKRVKADALISLALGLVQPEHVQQLQEATLTNADRLEMMYRDYIKQNGAMAKDEFIGYVMLGLIGRDPRTGAVSKFNAAKKDGPNVALEAMKDDILRSGK